MALHKVQIKLNCFIFQ